MTDFEGNPEPQGIIMLHAAAVTTAAGAWLFLGPSGTGKSTLTDMLAPYLSRLADDKVYLIPRDGQWLVADIGARIFRQQLTEQAARALHGPPLAAVFRLYQAETARIIPLSAARLCMALTHAFWEIPWQRKCDAEHQRTVFQALAEVTRGLRGYSLYSDRSAQVPALLAPLYRGSS